MQNGETSEKGDGRKDRDSNTLFKEDADIIMITGSPGQLKFEKERECISSSSKNSNEKNEPTLVHIIISNGDFPHQNSSIDDLKKNLPEIPESAAAIGKIVKPNNKTSRIPFPSTNAGEQCRVCHQLGEEPLMNLGCQCRGELGNAHESCIRIWFHTRGNNRCEICQEIATNVPFSETRSKKDSSRPVAIALWIILGGCLMLLLLFLG